MIFLDFFLSSQSAFNFHLTNQIYKIATDRKKGQNDNGQREQTIAIIIITKWYDANVVLFKKKMKHLLNVWELFLLLCLSSFSSFLFSCISFKEILFYRYCDILFKIRHFFSRHSLLLLWNIFILNFNSCEWNCVLKVN